MDSTLSGYQAEICRYTFVIELCGLQPYVITIRLYICLVFLTEWLHAKVSLSKEHQTHTQTDCNDIPEDGLKNGTETCKGKFLIVFNVNFSDF